MATLPIAGALDQSTIPYNQPLVKKINEAYIKSDDVLTHLPMPTKASQIAHGRRILGGLPTINWTGYNAQAATVRTSTDPYAEQAYMYRNQILWDDDELSDENIIGGKEEEIGRQITSFTDAVTFENWKNFITNAHKGRTGDNKNAPVGVYERIDNPAYKIVSEMKMNGNLDISPGMSQATAVALFSKIHRLIINTGNRDGSKCFLALNLDMWIQIRAAIMIMPTGSFFRIDTDAYNREIPYLYGARVIDVGRAAPDTAGNQDSYPITSCEQADGTPGVEGTDAYSSIVVVKTGLDAMHGWRFRQRKVMRLGINKSAGTEGAGIMDGVYMSDYFGWVNEGIRDCGRIYGLKVK